MLSCMPPAGGADGVLVVSVHRLGQVRCFYCMNSGSTARWGARMSLVYKF